jgi:hypothetical protein
MTWHPQRLPITLQPLPGESLDSWLEAYARRLRACSRDLLDMLGLTGSTLTHMVTTLTDRERDILSTAIGIAPDALTRMTLQPFDGIAVTIDPVRRTVVHPPAWRRQAGSRFCPACLHDSDGRWQLTWRLPWAFACPIHTCLLVDHCPACRKRPTPHRPGTRAQAAIAGRCTVSLPNPGPGGWQAQVCGHPLTEIPSHILPVDGRVVAAQQRAHHLVAAAVSTSDPARRRRIRRTLGELHTLAYKSLDALHTTATPVPGVVDSVVNECGATVPARHGPLHSYTAHTVAVGTSIAVIAHQDDPTGDSVLSWIITADRHQRMPAEPGRILSPWKDASPALTERLLTALDPHLRAHDRLVYGSASTHPRRPAATDEQIRRRAASLPALLWPAWAIRLIPTDHTTHNAVVSRRAALAVMTLIPGTRLTHPQANALLGGYTTRASATRILTRLPPQQQSATIAILTDLARTLDATPAPIDYTRRRALFTPSATIDRHAYAELAAARRWRPPSPLQLRILDDHLTVLLTGTHAGHHTTRIRWGNADAWNPHTAALPSPVREFVHGQAQLALRHHQIDEPVTWHPPPPADAPWPGVDPDSIDPHHFAHAFTTHATTRHGLDRIGRATGLSNLHIRLYTHIAPQLISEQQWDSLADHPDHDVLTPAALRHLYHSQQLSMMDIARQSLTTERIVRSTLATAGATLLSHRPHAKAVPLEWFQQHYLGAGKTLRQAAAEAGISRNTFSKYARQHNIPTGPHAPAVNPFAGWPAHQQPPPSVVAACSGPHGVEYVRQVLKMPGHATRRAAAQALGLHEQNLCRHRQQVERAAGVHIFQPDPPLTPTAEGATFLRHAARAVQRLDQSTSGKS